MSHSVDGESQSAATKTAKSGRVSDKFWHMTWNESTKQIFVWECGRRLDIGGGVSAGPVSVIEEHAVEVANSISLVITAYTD
jgi:hypothetical protein